MVILNIELGEELERRFYQRAKEKNLSYLEYVKELIEEDIESYENILEERRKSKKEEGIRFQSSLRKLS